MSGTSSVPAPPVWPRAPAIPWLACCAAGILGDRYANPTWSVWLWLLAAALPVATVVVLWPASRTTRGRAVAESLALGLLWGSLAGAWHHWRTATVYADDIARHARESPTPARIRGEVVDSPVVIPKPRSTSSWKIPQFDRTRFTLNVREWVSHEHTESASGTVRVEVTGHLTGVRSGDVVECVGEIARPLSARNPGGFDFARFLRDRGQHALFRTDQPEGVTVLRRRPVWIVGINPLAWLERARERCQQTLTRVLSEETAPLGIALLLGTRTDIDPELKRDFAESGTAHILAISGANVALFAGMLWAGVCLVTPSRRWRLGLVMVALLGYLLLTDWQPPVVRSVIMLELWLWGRWRERSSNGWNTLAVAGVLMLALHPEQLFDIGALLSFLAVATLMETSRIASRWNRALAERFDTEVETAGSNRSRSSWRSQAQGVARQAFRSLRRSAVEWYVTTVVIWCVTTPLVVSQFHLLSGAGLIVNVLLSPVTGGILVCGYLVLISALTVPVLAFVFGPLFEAGLQGLVWMVGRGAEIPGGAIYLAGPPAWWVAGFYAGLGVWLWQRRQVPFGVRVRRAWLLWLAVPGLWLMRPMGDGELRVTWLSVGHGGATLVELPNGRTFLYDAGRLLDEDRAPEIIQNALWSRGKSHLDLIVLSHPDIDHFNAVPRLVEVMPPGTICVHPSFVATREPSVRDSLERWTRVGVTTRLVWSGDRLRLDPEVDLEILSPAPNTRHRADNDNSLVVRVTYRAQSALLTGDLEGEGLVELLAQPAERIAVLQAPHHGGAKSNTSDLARWGTPRYVVVAGGRRDTLPRLAGIYAEAERVFATREDGAIIMRVSRSGDLSVRSFPER